MTRLEQAQEVRAWNDSLERELKTALENNNYKEFVRTLQSYLYSVLQSIRNIENDKTLLESTRSKELTVKYRHLKMIFDRAYRATRKSQTGRRWTQDAPFVKIGKHQAPTGDNIRFSPALFAIAYCSPRAFRNLMGRIDGLHGDGTSHRAPALIARHQSQQGVKPMALTNETLCPRPIHMAAMMNHDDHLLEILLFGVDPNARDYHGNTASDYAALKGAEETAAVLRLAQFIYKKIPNQNMRRIFIANLSLYWHEKPFQLEDLREKEMKILRRISARMNHQAMRPERSSFEADYHAMFNLDGQDELDFTQAATTKPTPSTNHRIIGTGVQFVKRPPGQQLDLVASLTGSGVDATGHGSRTQG